MLIPIQFTSVNLQQDLPPGRYEAKCSLFAAVSGPMHRAMLWKYRKIGSSSPAACDLLLVERDGSVRVRDYLWMPDLSWRDSSGERGSSLAALFPQELMDLKFVREEQADDIVLGS